MKYVNENGRSMVEMLGVLAIIGVLSVGGIAGYSKAMNKYKINKTTDQVSMLVANIRTIYSTQGNYKGLDEEAAINFGVVPNDMINSDGKTLSNAFGGAVTIAEADGRKSEDGEAFIIAYEGLTKEACITIATGDWGSGQASGLLGIAAAGTDDAATVVADAYTTGYSATPTQTTSLGGNSGLMIAEGDTTSGSTATNTVCKADSCLAVPGGVGGAAKTPMPVTDAVAACSDEGSSNSVAWKYY